MLGHSQKEDNLQIISSLIDGLKRVYNAKVRPAEVQYKFGDFLFPVLTDSEFDGKPLVLFLGQYSTGKTSFIRYLLERDFPGQHVGPEPTTDRFTAIMHGKEDRIIPGNTLSVQPNLPFRGLNRLGSGFLNKFCGVQMNHPALQDMIFIDTPGVLSGEKQSIGRSYDFIAAVEWFVQRADLIFILFDAHKLDISDEFKRTINTLRGHDDKIRVVLNKADTLNTQQLVRVYGALMWSLGKVIQTPEVMRIYLGSFWDKPYINKEYGQMFLTEQCDLLQDLRALPRGCAWRKINDFVKRTRLLKVHCFIIGHLKNEMPMLFGKESKKEELIKGLDKEFKKIQAQYNLPPGDFPPIERFRATLKSQDIDTFPKFDVKYVTLLDEVLVKDIGELISMFPNDPASDVLHFFNQEKKRMEEISSYVDSPCSSCSYCSPLLFNSQSQPRESTQMPNKISNQNISMASSVQGQPPVPTNINETHPQTIISPPPYVSAPAPIQAPAPVPVPAQAPTQAVALSNPPTA
eukprot:TRINITY_DN1234_c0_g1_i1.p1 TRINITY_DN1234_c0_g1~~TRINITY_DN1234_c0_g1_i1.p1  ORF type:complete len:518 (-),score=85.82 TRINITY_DN1234_c0_g1_i1:17-1570(-)